MSRFISVIFYDIKLNSELYTYFSENNLLMHVYFTRCFRHVSIGIFKNFPILTILQLFQLGLYYTH